MDHVLAGIATEHALRLAVEIGIDFDVAVNRAWQWAQRFSYHWIADITDTTRLIVQNAVAKFVSTPDDDGDLRNVLNRFNPLRADRIAGLRRQGLFPATIYQEQQRG